MTAASSNLGSMGLTIAAETTRPETSVETRIVPEPVGGSFRFAVATGLPPAIAATGGGLVPVHPTEANNTAQIKAHPNWQVCGRLTTPRWPICRARAIPLCDSNRHRGGKGSRTPDLLNANQALYQLSYTPGGCRPELSANCDFAPSETPTSTIPGSMRVEASPQMPGSGPHRVQWQRNDAGAFILEPNSGLVPSPVSRQIFLESGCLREYGSFSRKDLFSVIN